jgi:hypothetical protein
MFMHWLCEGMLTGATGVCLLRAILVGGWISSLLYTRVGDVLSRGGGLSGLLGWVQSGRKEIEWRAGKTCRKRDDHLEGGVFLPTLNSAEITDVYIRSSCQFFL